MARKTISIGSLKNFHVYDDAIDDAVVTSGQNSVSGAPINPFNTLTPYYAGTFHQPYDITITTDEDNLSIPAGQYMRLSNTTGSSKNITGFTDTSMVVDRFTFLCNVGTDNIILKHEDAGSSAVNRIHTQSGSDYILAPDNVAVLLYDNTTQRWRPFGGEGAGGTSVAIGDPISGSDTYSLLYVDGSNNLSDLGSAADGEIPIGVTGAAPVLNTITGTTNQINVSNGAGSITLSTPQDLHTGAAFQVGTLLVEPGADGMDIWKVNNSSGVVVCSIDTSAERFYFSGEVEVDGDINHDGTKVGFLGATPIARQTVTGSRASNAALASLLTALESFGLITDSTTL